MALWPLDIPIPALRLRLRDRIDLRLARLLLRPIKPNSRSTCSQPLLLLKLSLLPMELLELYASQE